MREAGLLVGVLNLRALLSNRAANSSAISREVVSRCVEKGTQRILAGED
jgi:hypothetical protein